MTELRWGYTMADLHALARLAVHAAGRLAADWHERYDVAWSAIAEALYAADTHPPRHDLVYAGRLALYAMVDADRQAHGYYRRRTDGGLHGPASSPAFATYWGVFAHHVGSCEDAVVERTALAQILPTLSAGEREAIVALAVHGDHRAAAAALGMTYRSYLSQLARGRRRYRQWWHEGEAPSRPWGCDRRADRSGSPLDGVRGRARAARRRGAA